MVDAVYRIDWTESERGWGQSSAGHSDYDTLEEAKTAIVEHWKKYPDDHVPDYYIRPSEPYLVEKEKDA